jgi:hypothetical protein
MVHLNQVPTDKEIGTLPEGVGKINFEERDADTFTASVYGSKYAGLDLPKVGIILARHGGEFAKLMHSMKCLTMKCHARLRTV